MPAPGSSAGPARQTSGAELPRQRKHTRAPRMRTCSRLDRFHHSHHGPLLANRADAPALAGTSALWPEGEQRRRGPSGPQPPNAIPSGNAGRSSDSQAQPAVAFSPGWPNPRQMPGRGHNGQWLDGSRPQTPGYSGGAVPESHRSSLFAHRSQRRSAGHQNSLGEFKERAGVVKLRSDWPYQPPSQPNCCRACEAVPVRQENRLTVERL